MSHREGGSASWTALFTSLFTSWREALSSLSEQLSRLQRVFWMLLSKDTSSLSFPAWEPPFRPATGPGVGVGAILWWQLLCAQFSATPELLALLETARIAKSGVQNRIEMVLRFISKWVWKWGEVAFLVR